MDSDRSRFNLKSALRGPYKAISRELRWKRRLATSGSRVLPDFVVIGAQKCGTTSLHYYLRQHPQIHRAYRKEVHYFDGGIDPTVDNFAKGERWYRAHFPVEAEMAAGDVAFDASPLYVFNPLAPKRIFDLVPEAKLILILRNPVERAISHYFMSKKLGFEDLPLLEALIREEERIEPIIRRRDFKNLVFIHNSYKARGRYAEQINRYVDYFGWDQIHIISSADFRTQPDETLRKVYEFVGVDADVRIPDLQKQNVARGQRDIEEGAFELLSAYFEAPNRELNELLGKDFGWSALRA